MFIKYHIFVGQRITPIPQPCISNKARDATISIDLAFTQYYSHKLLSKHGELMGIHNIMGEKMSAQLIG